jgi:peptidyl-prolyl cis-trans isomerase SurA
MFNADSLPSTFSKPVIKLGKTTKTQMDFANYVAKNQKKQINIDKDVYLNKLFDQFVEKTCMDFKDVNLEKEYPEFASLMKEYHDGILLFNLSDEKVWSKAVKDTAGLKKFFNENRVNYQWSPRALATVYHINKKEDVDKALAIIKNGDQDGDIAKQLLADSISSVKIIPGKFEKGDNKYVDTVKWEPGFYEAGNSDVEDLHVYVKIKKILKPQAKELEEARGLVTADYQNYLEKEWVKNLKQKYPVTVNEKVLAKVIRLEQNKK